MLDIGIWLVSGSSGVGGRIGWQKFIAPNMAFRVGLKPGFAEWGESFTQKSMGRPDEHEHVVCIHNGVELTPHAQFVWFGKHGTAGVGIDIPILFSVRWLTLFENFNDSNQPHPVAGGVGVYFRWSVF